MFASDAATYARRDSIPTILRPTFHSGKLAQPRAEHKLHNIASTVPQRVSFGRRAVALTAAARYASDQGYAEFSQSSNGSSHEHVRQARGRLRAQIRARRGGQDQGAGTPQQAAWPVGRTEARPRR